MRNLYDYVYECEMELDDLDIPYAEYITFKVNTRAKKRWGNCRKNPDGSYIIQINVELLNEANSVNGLKNTIIHELLHTCEGCMNHGKQWKRYADRVNRAYGYGITRCSSAEDKGVVTREIKPIEYKYIVKCECCGQTIRRSKMSKVIKYTDMYTCGICGGKLKRIK